MYQWRKFEFFEEKHAGKCAIPDDVTGNIQCCSSGRGKVVIGCHDGVVCLLDRGLKFNYAFSAHSSSVLFLQQLKVQLNNSISSIPKNPFLSFSIWMFDFWMNQQRNLLVSIGEDDQVAPQHSTLCLKVFDLDKIQPQGSSTTIPECVGILRIFTNQFPEAKVNHTLVYFDFFCGN